MRTQSRDTSAEIERILIRGHQRLSPATRFGRVRSMTYTLAEANRHNAPAIGDEYAGAVSFAQHLYGVAYAAAFRAFVPQPDAMAFDLQVTLENVDHLFTDRHIPFALTGSLACCMYGFPRTCHDIDLLVDRRDFVCIGSVASLFAIVDDNSQQVSEFPALAHWLDPQTLIKVDVLVAPMDFSADRLLSRARPLTLSEQGFTLPVLAAEDVVLTRLQWYHATGCRADDQWNDLMGIVKVQAPMLDAAYLKSQAHILHLTALLTQLFIDTDFEEAPHVTAAEFTGCPTDDASRH